MTPEQEILSGALESAARIGVRLRKSVAHFEGFVLDADALRSMGDERREKLDPAKQIAAINPALALSAPLIHAFEGFDRAVRDRHLLENPT